MTSEVPTNQVLSSRDPSGDPDAVLTPPASESATYPKCVYHRDSVAGALISRLVVSAEEERSLGSDWGSLADLQIETAPAKQGD